MNASRRSWTSAASTDPLTLRGASKGHLMRNRYSARASAGGPDIGWASEVVRVGSTLKCTYAQPTPASHWVDKYLARN